MTKTHPENQAAERDQSEDAASRRVAEGISAAIVAGHLPPGTPLREMALSERYGVGRYTIRSALRELEISGLAESRRFAGYRVRALTADDAKDIFSVRLLLETEAARIAMGRPETWECIKEKIDQLMRLESLHLKSRDIGDDSYNAASLEADLAVHRAIIEASGSPRLVSAYNLLISEIRLCFSWISLKDSKFSPGHHDKLLMSIQSGDTVHATSAFRVHILESLQDILQQIRQA